MTKPEPGYYGDRMTKSERGRHRPNDHICFQGPFIRGFTSICGKELPNTTNDPRRVTCPACQSVITKAWSRPVEACDAD